ncbi:MAG TPA: RNA chaperone Hfq [Abditibacteriaceae bacterium]|nr:RNA chaperone Hfq [Abditibacteriaceae bacterium]
MFLNGLRRENIDVVIYFGDGSQERGAVRAFDTFTILLENRQSGKAQLIYKHAVARIFPVRTPSLRPDRPAQKS